ncbi:hypothetical protein NUSPORA_01202 [Nucleospora cyclopteri]
MNVEDESEINVADFVNARGKEIQSIEKSLEKSNKKSLIWQRMPFYKRRRNRCYIKKCRKKFTFRKTDRHFLRSHTFFAKRFFMLKIGEKFSIPLQRRLKSDSYIAKSMHRGFVMEESFRPVFVSNSSKAASLLKNHQFIKQANNYEIARENEQIYSIGEKIDQTFEKTNLCVLSIYKVKNIQKAQWKLFRNKNSDEIETFKIICEREEIMGFLNDLIKISIIPVCLKEIDRISTENQALSLYDNVNSDIYKSIQTAKIQRIKEIYEKTPKGKKVNYDTSKLSIESVEDPIYFYFKLIKGNAKDFAEIFYENILVGRVIRGSYNYSKGCSVGLGVSEKINKDKLCKITIKNLDQNNFYPVEIYKYFN